MVKVEYVWYIHNWQFSWGAISTLNSRMQIDQPTIHIHPCIFNSDSCTASKWRPEIRSWMPKSSYKRARPLNFESESVVQVTSHHFFWYNSWKSNTNTQMQISKYNYTNPILWAEKQTLPKFLLLGKEFTEICNN